MASLIEIQRNILCALKEAANALGCNAVISAGTESKTIVSIKSTSCPPLIAFKLQCNVYAKERSKGDKSIPLSSNQWKTTSSREKTEKAEYANTCQQNRDSVAYVCLYWNTFSSATAKIPVEIKMQLLRKCSSIQAIVHHPYFLLYKIIIQS